MASNKSKNVVLHREDWPRIRTVTIRGTDFYQVDGRPHYTRKTYTSLVEARKQADKWQGARERYGTAGKYISERDASEFARALDILAPHKASIIDAAQHFAKHLETETKKRAGKTVADALAIWAADYEKKDCKPATAREIKSMAKIFDAAFGRMPLRQLAPGQLVGKYRFGVPFHNLTPEQVRECVGVWGCPAKDATPFDWMTARHAKMYAGFGGDRLTRQSEPAVRGHRRSNG